MKLMFSCKDIHQRSSQYINGENSLLTKAGVLMHILMCGHCRLFIKQLRLTVKTIKKIPQHQQHNEDELDAMVDKLLANHKHIKPKA
jgi:predicted anti-sigma-YlaC factor YlaD